MAIAQDTRFLGTLAGALVDMEGPFFGVSIASLIADAEYTTDLALIFPNTQIACDVASTTYDELVSQFDDIESDLNDEFDGATLERAQEHLDLAFHALDEVRIHMSRFERLTCPEADDETDAHDLSD